MTAAYAVHDVLQILLVEPADAVAAPIRALLEQNGFAVDHIASAAEARTHDLSRYAVVIVDVRLDDREGLALIQWLHREESHLLGRIVIVSADAGVAHALEEIDVCDIVPKPVDAREILRAVQECLETAPVQ